MWVYEKMKCCLCGMEMYSYNGNNALPVKKGLCCDKCNIFKVLPIRVMNTKNEKT